MMKKLFLGTVGIFSLALLITVFATPADAYESYHDPALNDAGYCATCHEVPDGSGFGGGQNDDTHSLHTKGDAVTGNCSLCHTGSGRDNPLIMWSGGDGTPNSMYGCMGCHGRDYGETIAADYRGFPTTGMPKMSGYGLRAQHALQGVTVCTDCHNDTGVTILGENINPPYYGRTDVSLGDAPVDSCFNEDTLNTEPNGDDLVGLDNDGDGLIDTADPDCAPEICDDGIDNDGDGDIDCADSQCDGQTGPNGEICEFGTELTCNDTFDNDADGPADCADQDCNGQTGALGEICEFGTELSCFDGFDNDADGPADCVDTDCDGASEGLNTCTVAGQLGECAKGENQCDVGAETCVQTIVPLPTEDCLITGEDNDCDGLLPADDPDCAGVENCFNGVDDDGDGLVDCVDTTDCNGAVGPATTCGQGECAGNTGNLTCTGGVEVDTCDPFAGAAPDDSLCNGLDDDCDGPIDEDYVIDDTCGIGFCGAPNNTPSSCVSGVEALCAPGPEGVEGPEGDLTCSDLSDNDCDGATDEADVDCGAQAAAPPVNQNLGFIDTTIANSGLERADCLNEANGCHVEAGIEDRHHLLYNSDIPTPSVVPYPGLVTNAGDPLNDLYNCQGCHSNEALPIIELDCAACHLVDGAVSPHHGTALALARNCKACHGDLVDNFDDGHYIPIYEPSLVTPTRSMGDGLPLNSYNNGAGACNYCHDSDAFPGGSGTGTVILSNEDNHHDTGLFDNPGDCTWCHDTSGGPGPMPLDEQTRICEQCHGPDSLHNIQADSNGDGIIDIGGELAGYGHVGRDQGPGDSDCWGCHGFAGISSAPGSGPAIPTVGGSDVSTMVTGTATPVTLSGAAFTNTSGTTQYTSDISLTAADGSSVTLTPDSISEGTLAVTIPAGTAPGNYDLRAVKAENASNPAVVSITPTAAITGTTCADGTATISGSGFSGYQEGSGTSVTGTIVTGKGKRKVTTTENGAVSSWSDTQIVADFSACPQSVDVTTVFAGGGDPTGSCSAITDDQICIDDPACDWNCNKKGRCSCSDGGGDPPTGSCSENGDLESCEAAGCNWNSKKNICK